MDDEFDPDKPIHILLRDSELLHEITRFLRNYAANIKTFRHINKFMEMPLSDAPSCLITTLDSSDEHGVSLIKRVQSKGLSIPVIVVATEDDNVYSAVKAMQAGAADFINRPIIERDFIDRLDQVVKKST